MNGRVKIHIREMGIRYTPQMTYLSAQKLEEKMLREWQSDKDVCFYNEDLIEMSINPEYIVSIELETV